MRLHIPAKALIRMCYQNTIYYMTLSTGKQRRHMINEFRANKEEINSKINEVLAKSCYRKCCY